MGSACKCDVYVQAVDCTNVYMCTYRFHDVYRWDEQFNLLSLLYIEWTYLCVSVAWQILLLIVLTSECLCISVCVSVRCDR